MNKHFLLILSFIFPDYIFSQSVFQRKIHLNDSIYYQYTLTLETPDHHLLNMTHFGDPFVTNAQLHLIETDSAGIVTQYRRYFDVLAVFKFINMDILPSGQFAVAGRYNGDMMLATFSGSGSILSITSFDVGLLGTANDVIHSSSSFILCGNQSNPYRGVVVETDISGNFIRANEYQVNNYPTSFNHAVMLGNGNRFFAGNMNAGHVPAVFMNADSTGNVQWCTRLYHAPFTITPKATVELADGSLIVAGNITDPTPPASYSIFMLKLSPSGQLVWSRKYWIASGIMLNGLVPDGNEVVFSGYTFPSAVMSKTFICRADTAGNILSGVQYHDSFYDLTGQSIAGCHDNGYLVTAMVPVGNGYVDHYLLKTDNSFVSQCNATPFILADTLLPLSDSSGIDQYPLFPAISFIPSSVLLDSFLIPIESDACGGAGIFENENISGLTVYTRENYFEIVFYSVHPENESISVFDLTGRCISSLMTQSASGKNYVRIDSGEYAQGIYLVSVRLNNTSQSVKVIKN